MARRPERAPVSQFEVVLLFCLAGGLACVALLALVTGWFWVPGQRYGGQGYWSSRADNLGGYVLYLGIIGAAALGFTAMAVARHRRFTGQGSTSRRRR